MTKRENKNKIQQTVLAYVVQVTTEPHHDVVLSQGSINDVLQDFYAQFLEDIQNERDRKNALALYFSVYQVCQYRETFYLLTTLKEGETHG